MSGTIEQQEAVEAPEPRALIEAVEQGNEDEVKSLIDAGVPVDETDSRGKNALVEAVSRCNETLVHLLVVKGKAFVNTRDVYGRTPLFYAITKSKKIAKYLIEKGADVNLKDFSNRSPLSFFVEDCMMNKDIQLPTLISAKQEEFQMLTDPSKDVTLDIQTILSIVLCKLPLMCATDSKMWTNPSTPKTRPVDEETIEKTWKNFIPALKEASKNFEEKDTKKNTILEDILRKCEENKPFSAMCQDTIELLVQLDADPNFADADGNTALHYAASLPWMGVSQETTKDICTQLHRFGVPLNAKNHRGQTPLLFCLSGSMEHLEEEDKVTAMKALVEVCKFLITRGSSLEETTQDGESVFHLVIKLFQQGLEIPMQRISKDVIDETKKILRLFSCDRLNEGTTVNKRDSRLNSPLHNWATMTLPPDVDYVGSGLLGTTLEEILEHLLKVGATLTPRNENEETPLHLCKTWNAVKLLADAGANPKDVDSSGRSPLLTAAKNKELVTKPGYFYPDVLEDPKAFWESAIEKGLDPWATDEDGESVLSVLIDEKAFSLVKPLLNKEFINKTDDEGKTAMLYAVQQSNENVVRILIDDAGADVKKTDNEGKTSLFYAAENENEKIVELLIQGGADVNATDKYGATPLYYSMEKKHENIAQKLIAFGAAINITDKEHKTTLLYAKSEENGNTALSIADMHKTEGRSALLSAIYKGEKSKFENLIHSGADIHATDKDGRTALIYAVREGDKEMVDKLIEIGSEINAKDKNGESAFFYAVWQENEELVQTLLDSSAKINVTDSYGKTALFYAIKQENERIVKTFIDRGADVNATESNGKTALVYAIERENKTLVETLIHADGADVNRTDNEGKTALFYAVQVRNNESVVRALVDAGADVNRTDNEGKTALFYAVQQNNNEIVVRTLIDAGANVKITDTKGETALFYALTVWNNESVVRALIEAGADVNRINNDGKTALFYTVQGSLYENAVRVLLDTGADTNMKDLEGQTVLFKAVGNLPITRMLVEDGKAQINARDAYGRTSLFYAMKESLETASFLIEKGADLKIRDKCNVSIMAFYIEHCLITGQEICEGVNLLKEKGFEPKVIFKTVVSVVFCSSFKLRISIRFGEIKMEALSSALEAAKVFIDEQDPLQGTLNDILTTMKKFNIGKAVYENVVPNIIAPLVNLGADPNTADSKGNTALHYTTRLVFENVSQETVKDMCRDLEEVGASLNARNHSGESPVLFGLSEKFLGEVTKENTKWDLVFTHVYEILIQNGSRLDDNDKNGNSLFHLILILFQRVLYFEMKLNKRKRVLGEVADLFQLCCQADRKAAYLAINKTDNHLNSPLHLWSKLKWIGFSPEEDWKNLRKIFNSLLESGARLNARNEKDETPLHLCTSWRSVKLLLEEGANPNDLDSLGRTPLLSAALRFRERIRSNNTNLEAFYEDTSLSADAFWKDVLNQTKLDPWNADKHGQTVLGVLVESEAFVLAQALLKAAGEIMLLESDTIAASLLNAICKDRSSITHWKSILVEIILKARKSTITSLQCNGETALHCCCRNIMDAFHLSQATANDEQSSPSKEDLVDDEILKSVHWTIAKRLLHGGADCTIPDAIGQSCLEIAEACPPLKILLNGAIDMDVETLNIPWTSISKNYKQMLSEVARQQRFHVIGQFRYHPQYIGSGSFGAVFAGINENDGREVAIKRIEKIHMSRPEDKREIRNLTSLADCEQVVRYFQFFEDEHFSYIVLELMEGHLDQFLNLAISMDTQLLLCQDVVKGLKHLHDHNILHRDLKPTNILYKTHPKLCLKIADFGLSRRIDIIDHSTSVYGTNAGTRCWIAPEVLTSTKYQHSTASDMFSCGLVLHYILSVKKHPFSPEDCANKSEFQIRNETERNVIDGNKEGWDDSLSPEASNLLEQLLESDATKRPTAANSLTDLLFWPLKIKSWRSISKVHKKKLAYVARERQSIQVKPYWYHTHDIALGSFGAVFAGINENDGREVAIKRIEKIRLNRPKDKREIRNLIALADCEQVVRYSNFLEDEHFSYVVLELMDGNLDEYLNNTTTKEVRSQICEDVVRGLQFLHSKNILHRDLKPTNILFKFYFENTVHLKIADFGLSRRMDSTGSSTSVSGNKAGTRCWIAPEVLRSENHSKSSDVFACGLVLHYILSVKKHPFAVSGTTEHETEANILNSNMEGWDVSLCPEAAHLLKAMLDGDKKKRPSAGEALDHPFFWTKEKKLDLLTAVGNQPEIQCPRAKRTSPLTAVETDLETSFGTIVKYADWNDPRYACMPSIYIEMSWKRRRYDTRSVVELVGFIRNAIQHVSKSTRPIPIRKQILEDFVFLEYFPNLVMEVYKAVTTHGWDQTREEIKYAMKK